MTIKKVLAIIVDYQGTQDAERLSLQIASHAFPFELKVIHFDNGNQPATVLSIDQKKSGVSLVRSEFNLGYAGALHTAIVSTKSEFELHEPHKSYDAYWFLNSDLILEPGCLEKLVQTLGNHPRVGAVGPRVLKYPKTTEVWGARGKISPLFGLTSMTDWPGGLLPKWSYIPGCSLLVRRLAYEEVGGLPQYYKLYFEETELCVRLQKKKWELWVTPEARVFHQVQSLKGGIPARHFAYYFTRNNLTFWKKTFGIPVWIQFPRTLWVVFKEVLLPLRRATTWEEFWDRIQYTLAGLWDGLLHSQDIKPRFESQLFKP